MAALDNVYARVANDTVHDLAAAVAMVTPYTPLVVRSALGGLDAPAALLARTAWSSIAIALIALGVILVTGGVRLRSRLKGIRPQAVPARGRAAVIKHTCFVTVVVLGFAVAVWTASGGGA